MTSSAPEAESYSVREIELLAKVKSLEDDRVKFLDIVRSKISKLEKDLEVSHLVFLLFFFCV